MIHKSPGQRLAWLAPLLILISAANASGSQLAKAQKRSRNNAATTDLSQLTRPQLLNADSNPTLRYPIASFSGWSVFSTSYGWLDVTQKGIRYTVVEPESKKDEGFEAESGGISEIKYQNNYLLFHTDRKKRTIFYASQDRWGSIHSGPGAIQTANMGASGTASIYQAFTNFDRLLAAVKPPHQPGPEITFRAEPGTIEKGHSVTLVWTTMNATQVDLQPGMGNMAVAGSTSVMPQDSTTYTLTATGTGGSRVATARVNVTQPTPASPPTIILIEPSVGSSGQTVDVAKSQFIIRGVAMDSSGIPAVTINGMPAAMRPKSAQAAEFSSDPFTLQAGENRFEVSATNAAHAEAKVTFIAHYSPLPPPPEKLQPVVTTSSKGLDKSDIIDLLKGAVPSARLADLVKQRGVKFVPNDHDLNEIRAAGGEDDLIEAIKQAAATPPSK